MEPQQEGPSFQTPTRFTLLPTQLQILQEALADVKNLDSKKERRRKIKTIRTQILALPESQTLDANGKEDLGAAINTWFSLRAKRQTDKLKFGKKWNARLVFHQQNKEKVQETQLKLYQKAIEKGENPKRQFDFLQLAISKLWKKQSKAERNGLEKLAKQWNKEGAPREQKQTYVIIFLGEHAGTNPECIARPTRIHGNIRKSSHTTCTTPSGFGSCF
jgi:hypothetical protein